MELGRPGDEHPGNRRFPCQRRSVHLPSDFSKEWPEARCLSQKTQPPALVAWVAGDIFSEWRVVAGLARMATFTLGAEPRCTGPGAVSSRGIHWSLGQAAKFPGGRGTSRHGAPP